MVEDEPKLARSLRGSLERAGYAVDLASDGEAALDYAGIYDYDVMLLDVMLPKQDGFQVLRRLRETRFRRRFSTGAGIPASETERIFERFYRADPSRDRRTGGAGLGFE